MRSGVLILNAHQELREKRESQVTVARGLEQAARTREVAAQIRHMSELYRERLVGNRETK